MAYVVMAQVLHRNAHTSTDLDWDPRRQRAVHPCRPRPSLPRIPADHELLPRLCSRTPTAHVEGFIPDLCRIHISYRNTCLIVTC